MITVILGTKAQLIKMVPIMRELMKRDIPYRFIHTGQHKETMDEMYSDFGVKKPDLQLYYGPDIVSVSQIIVWFVRLIYLAVINRKKCFGEHRKGIVLVHGDTLSTLVGAIMGRFAGVKVGHVESGLRSYSLLQPFPEELTRRLVFQISHILFCPGEWAVNNVINLRNKEIVNTGNNTMVDTISLSMKKEGESIVHIEKPFVLVSLHRYENIFRKNQLEKIVYLLEGVAKKHKLFFILHPPTENQLKKYGYYQRLLLNGHVELVSRMHHSVFLRYLKSAEFVITDGGSLQEEAAYLGIPCLLFREKTERKEGLTENVVLSKFDESVILEFADQYKTYQKNTDKAKISPSSIIIDSIEKYK